MTESNESKQAEEITEKKHVEREKKINRKEQMNAEKQNSEWDEKSKTRREHALTAPRPHPTHTANNSSQW